MTDPRTTISFDTPTSSPSSYPPQLPQLGSPEIEDRPPLSESDRREMESPMLRDHAPLEPNPTRQLPSGKELEDLIQLYFSSVHRKDFCIIGFGRR